MEGLCLSISERDEEGELSLITWFGEVFTQDITEERIYFGAEIRGVIVNTSSFSPEFIIFYTVLTCTNNFKG